MNEVDIRRRFGAFAITRSSSPLLLPMTPITPRAAIIEHGGFGASVAAPLIRDTLLFLFDKEKALAEPRRVRTGPRRNARPADRSQDRPMAPGKRTTAPTRQTGMITSAIIPRPLARLPWRLIFLVAGIAFFGLVVLYSAAGGSAQPWAVKQAIVFIFFLTGRDRHVVDARSDDQVDRLPAVQKSRMIMLVGVEALGFVSKGAQRWLELGPVRLQPSEFMEPAIVLTLARFYDLVPASEIRKWRAIWPAAVATCEFRPFSILVQPDLGTCIMVLLCGITVMFLAGLPVWLFVGPQRSGLWQPRSSIT